MLVDPTGGCTTLRRASAELEDGSAAVFLSLLSEKELNQSVVEQPRTNVHMRFWHCRVRIGLLHDHNSYDNLVVHSYSGEQIM